jgi:hypothetical protein
MSNLHRESANVFEGLRSFQQFYLKVCVTVRAKGVRAVKRQILNDGKRVSKMI